MRKIIIITILVVVYTLLRNFSKSTNQNQQKIYTVKGNVYVRYYGGMPDPSQEPPIPEDQIIAVANSECLRIHSDQVFDSSTAYRPLVTDGSGYYEIATTDSCFAIILIFCARQV